jgi:AcrR family transcriptional regulator
VAKRQQAIEKKRRIPHQTRANETVSAILEGAAQILEAGGLAAFTTNAVAERAGVSIGTLYQYFADKRALLIELARREMQAALAESARALQAQSGAAPEERVRALVRAVINAFHGRQRARKAVVQAVLAQGVAMELMTPIAGFIAELGARVGSTPYAVFARLEHEQLFVLTRAVLGAIRAAVLEEQPFLKSRSFEDEIVRLVMAYLRDVAARAG